MGERPKLKPLVSIIMNCYNGERFLREAIDSASAQAYTNWELVFWDNASTDGTREIALSYANDGRFKYHRAAVNTPLGPARNLALRKATGDYIAFLDADDAYMPQTLQRHVDLFASGEYGMVYGGATIIDEHSREITRRPPRYRSGRIFRELLGKYEVAMVGAAVSREVLEADGLGFDETMGYAPDYDLFMRIAAKHPVGVIPGVIVKSRRVSNSLTSKTLHLIAKEVGHTLTELERLYPEQVEVCAGAMRTARNRLNLYDSLRHINSGDYAEARQILRPVVWTHWKYLALFVLLHFPVRRGWLMRRLST